MQLFSPKWLLLEKHTSGICSPNLPPRLCPSGNVHWAQVEMKTGMEKQNFSNTETETRLWKRMLPIQHPCCSPRCELWLLEGCYKYKSFRADTAEIASHHPPAPANQLSSHRVSCHAGALLHGLHPDEGRG